MKKITKLLFLLLIMVTAVAKARNRPLLRKVVRKIILTFACE